MRSRAAFRAHPSFLLPLCLCFGLWLALMSGAARAAAPQAAAGAVPGAPGQAAAAAAGLTASEAHQLLSVLQDPARRGQFITTLSNLEKALPLAAAAAPHTAAAAAAAPAAATPAAAASKKVALQPNSLGADLLSQADKVLQDVAVNVAQTGTKVFDYREFGNWLSGLPENRATLSVILSALWRLALVLGLGLLSDYAVRRLTRPLYHRLGRESSSAERAAHSEIAQSREAVQQAVEHAADVAEAEGAEGTEAESMSAAEAPALLPTAREAEALAARGHEEERAEAAAEAAADLPELPPPEAMRPPRPFHSGWPLLRRLPFILAAMVVDAVPILAFLVVTNLLLASPLVGDLFVRLMISAIVNAYILCRLLLVLARGTFCAPVPKLRLLHLSNDAAGFLACWSRRIAIVVLIGFAIVQIGNVAGMTWTLENAIERLFSLVIHGMLIWMVITRRRQVAAWMHGDLGPNPTTWQRLKARLALVWHWQAIIIIVLGWFLFANEVTNRVAHPTRLILSTLGYLILFRVLHIVLLGALEKAFTLRHTDSDDRRALIAARAARYHKPLHHVFNVILFIFAFLGLMQIWGLPIFNWFADSHLGGRLMSSVMTIAFTLVFAIVIWETLNFVLQTYIDGLTSQGAVMRAARLRTVVPLFRNALLIALLVVFMLTVLSEIGVNIGPLLAGASIFGVALGFGSQKLVQDFINGMFLLLENAMQVGDWVTVAGVSGAVEQLSIRTLRLRDGDGAVHIIPFSSVTTVTNTNRGQGNVTVSVAISYEEDTDAAGQLLVDLVAQMRTEEAYAAGFLGDFGLWGVNDIDGRVATVMGRVSCTDTMRWPIQRELNRRIKLAFQEKGFHLMPSGNVLALQHPLDVRVERPPRPEAAAAAAAAGGSPTSAT
ncbi:mechanosensitive ion channel domain-containing protein [Acidisoma sp. C75]